MDWDHASARYRFLAEAFDGTGGFAPVVTYKNEPMPDGSTRSTPAQAKPSYLVQYPRESAAKYASRSALAVYVNHLRSACERYVGFLGRRRALRQGVDDPLRAAFLKDADRRGSSLDQFFLSVSLQAKARGAMLVVLDMPTQAPASLADQIATRAVPYLREIRPELITDYTINAETGVFRSVSIDAVHEIAGKVEQVTRTWTETGWAITKGKETVAQGEHNFGACPVLALLESGTSFPHVGRYAQIADLSKDRFNAYAELREILRSQTFSLLTLQVPRESALTFDVSAQSAAIGTHSMLTHEGDTPAFIAPDSGPAQTYLATIEELEAAIKRIQMDDATSSNNARGGSAAVESGVSRRLRFEALNADLTTFAGQVQSVERRVWAMFERALGLSASALVEWPSDYNLVDSLAELDILASMQSTGFPEVALAAKKRTIAGAEFDAADDKTKAAVLAAIDEQAQAAQGA
jgi:hypothetical protein